MTRSIQENSYVTDTMGFVLRLENRKTNPKLEKIFDSVESNKSIIFIPSIVFAEILYLSEKQRIGISLSDVNDYMTKFPGYKEYAMSFGVICASSQIKDIPELHDRLIAGTSRLLNLRLITNDPIIQASKFVETCW